MPDDPQPADAEGQPGQRIGLDDVGRGAAGVPGTRDALHRAVRRDPHLDGATRRRRGELLEQEADRVANVGPVRLAADEAALERRPADRGMGSTSGRHRAHATPHRRVI